jgi:hypothetical protein
MALELKTNLKTFRYFLLLVAVTVVFVGCSKDEEPDNPLRGKWNFTGTNSYGDIIDRTWTFNSNWSFTWIEEYNTYTPIDTIKGKYEIYKKDNIILNVTSSNNPDVPIGEYGIVSFAKYKDHIGEYLVFYNQNDEKHYKK